MSVIFMIMMIILLYFGVFRLFFSKVNKVRSRFLI